MFEYYLSRISDHYLTYNSTPSSGQLSNIFRILRPGWVIRQSLVLTIQKRNKMAAISFQKLTFEHIRYSKDVRLKVLGIWAFIVEVKHMFILKQSGRNYFERKLVLSPFETGSFSYVHGYWRIRFWIPTIVPNSNESGSQVSGI